MRALQLTNPIAAEMIVSGVSDQVLEEAERELERDLADSRGRTYAQRQAIAWAYVRVLVERKVRESERRAGIRN
jgi:hypothetical protein